ncbi:MAG: UbiD family decarboxylase [Gammaproteobacteria bacterium]|nr:UbiD family decarboxylase [Gammaproteobacteria bacterium]
MPKDLRQYLAQLEQRMPEEIVHIEREVDPRFELPAVLRKLQDENRYPAAVFHKVKGSAFPVVSNLFASRKRLALAFGVEPDNLLQGYMQLEDRLRKPRLVRHAPVHDVVHEGRKVDLTRLPVVTHCEKDAAPYFTSAVGVFKDPDTGIYDVGIFRMQLKGKNKVGVLYGAYSKAARVIRKNEQRNKPTQMAVYIGHHPASILCSQTKVPVDVDEFAVMGGLLDEPVELVEAKTVDVRVPARAEFVLEGEIPPHVREPEGPFGEYPWYYGLEYSSHVMHVKAITHRHDAIYHDIFSAHPDHNMCGKIQRESVIFKRVRMAVPGVQAVTLPLSGTCRHVGYVSIKKEFDGQGKTAAMAALVAEPMMKLAVIVDDDVDVEKETEVWWAVATRAQADRAIFTVPEAYVSELDPSAYSIRSRNERGYLGTKWAIDATKPINMPFEERADVPRDLWTGIDLKDYIPGLGE